MGVLRRDDVAGLARRLTDVLFPARPVRSPVYSLNVPVPGRVAALASDLARELPGARARVRGEHTLGVKRLVGDPPYAHLEARAREALAGQPAFGSRITGVECFEEVPTGTAPVVYLAVESPELERLHRRLATAFDPLCGIEGEEYVPHVTVARGGSLERARAVADRELDPLEWTVDELVFWDSHRGRPVSTVSLPA